MLGVLVRNPRFRRLWLAQVVSQAGDWFNRMALLALIGEAGGPRAAAGLGILFGVEIAARLLPPALLIPLAGPLADRLPRRLVMVASDLLRALTVVALLFVRDSGQLPLIYGLVCVLMALSTFFESAKSAALPSTVDSDDLHAAYALSAATWSTLLGVGALLGGVLLVPLGVAGVLVVDAASFVLSAWFLVGLRLPPVPTHPERFRWRDVFAMTEILRGIRHARERRVGSALFAKTFWGPCGGYLVALSLAGQIRFGDDGEGSAGLATGMLWGARGLGTGLGPLLGNRFLGGSHEALRRQISTGFVVAAVGYSLFAVAETLVPAMLCVVVAHIGGSMIWVGSTVAWQKRVDDAFRGRIAAAEMLGVTLSVSLGAVASGLAFDVLGSLEAMVWWTTGAVLIAGAAWTYLDRRAHPPIAPSLSTRTS